ncbi:ubiquitin domain-containing protein 2 [Exaiptasia diaphana]|uniref:Ubiquitin-like domain-containing protein n=1 Tax=Exaiptasia diaphana TaxID=2652724 RepID=A0A913XP77_EXADI|nr:ubiquitin domain-containing protein 2 [Exaiptasia diaphana]KXJ25365.1 Ubiquitin domain-containing protein 2 [Exaiptasia diaphana]
MGGCMGTSGDPSVRVESSEFGSTPGVTVGRNQPLKKERPSWTSEVPLTEGQLRSKRDEFWETAPAFEGRKEIWDALRAAAETNDHTLAQAIVDGANITLPTGCLQDAYDELGNRYVLPIYCISQPTNLIKDEDISGNLSDEVDDEKDNQPSGEETSVKLRLSTGKDLKLTVYTQDTILKIKKKLHKMEGVEPGQQRWFYSGRMLTDKMTIEEAKIQKNFVIQVILPQPTPVDN